mmetsp:Transcript_67456/g.197274  ORF Transcript_67456/g.197274 Transcript_67456/m.197274 type:complete len:219 (+) Transcript_67456:212-868(+)
MDSRITGLHWAVGSSPHCRSAPSSSRCDQLQSRPTAKSATRTVTGFKNSKARNAPTWFSVPAPVDKSGSRSASTVFCRPPWKLLPVSVQGSCMISDWMVLLGNQPGFFTVQHLTTSSSSPKRSAAASASAWGTARPRSQTRFSRRRRRSCLAPWPSDLARRSAPVRSSCLTSAMITSVHLSRSSSQPDNSRKSPDSAPRRSYTPHATSMEETPSVEPV